MSCRNCSSFSPVLFSLSLSLSLFLVPSRLFACYVSVVYLFLSRLTQSSLLLVPFFLMPRSLTLLSCVCLSFCLYQVLFVFSPLSRSVFLFAVIFAVKGPSYLIWERALP
jgi:hypothetical protein